MISGLYRPSDTPHHPIYSPVHYRLEAPILEILYGKTVFTRSAITSQKVNRFGWNLEHYEHIVGGWPWQILGAIRAAMTAWDAAKIFGQVNNARFHRFHVGQILRHLNTTTSIGEAVKTFGTEYFKILP